MLESKSKTEKTRLVSFMVQRTSLLMGHLWWDSTVFTFTILNVNVDNVLFSSKAYAYLGILQGFRLMHI